MDLDTGRGRSLGQYLLYIVCALILLYLILPIFVIIPISFSASRYLQFPPEGFSLQWYDQFFHGRNWMSATLRSFQVAIMTAFLATILGTMASLALVRGDFPGKRLLYGLIISPLIIPVIVTAVAVYYIFSMGPSPSAHRTGPSLRRRQRHRDPAGVRCHAGKGGPQPRGESPCNIFPSCPPFKLARYFQWGSVRFYHIL